MIKKYFVLLLVLAIVNQGFTQHNVVDNFKNNKKKWPLVDNSLHEVKIEDGLLIVNIFDTDADVYITNDFRLNSDYDFVMECEFTKLEGATGVGFLWGFKDEENYNRFLITTRDQEFNAITLKYGEVEWLADWTFSESINLDSKMNKLKVEKIGSEIKLYANDVFLTTISNTEMFGNRVGFFVGGTSKFEIDNFSLTFEKKTKRKRDERGASARKDN